MGNACSCNAEPEAFEVEKFTGGGEGFSADWGHDGLLESSSLGSVMKTRSRTGNAILAVKRISKRHIEGVSWKEEVMTLQKLDHPHVCKLHETLEDLMSVYLIMDLCQGGDLMNICENHSTFSEATAAVLVRQMASAVGHLHEHDVVHSDIRPENWLFQSPVKPESSVLDMTLKMINFGLASRHGRRRAQWSGAAPPSDGQARPEEAPAVHAQARQATGLRDFRHGICCIAPEQLDGSVDGKADVWALGVLSYFLLSGLTPFDLSEGTDSLENHHSFRNARFVFMPADIWRPISTQAKHFIALCLSRDRSMRPTAKHMLSLPWMRLAEAAADDTDALRSPDGKADPAWPSGFGSVLPTAQAVLGSLGRLRRLQVLERAAIITTARSLHGDELAPLQFQLESADSEKEGIIPLAEVLDILITCWSVECQDLLDMVRDGTAVSISYAHFITDVGDFQRNSQDAAVSAVFRPFDSGEQEAAASHVASTPSRGEGLMRASRPWCCPSQGSLLCGGQDDLLRDPGGGLRVRRTLVAAALQRAGNQKAVQVAYPRVSLKGVKDDLQRTPNAHISIDELQSLLQRSKRMR